MSMSRSLAGLALPKALSVQYMPANASSACSVHVLMSKMAFENVGEEHV